MRGRLLAVCIALTTLAPFVPAQDVPGVSHGPENVVVFEEDWGIEKVADRLAFPTNVDFRGEEMILVESGRDPYATKYDGEDQGRVSVLSFDDDGEIAAEHTLADGLADPLGLEVAPDGDVFFTQYGEVSRIPANVVDERGQGAESFSHGHPSQTFDFVYAPLTGTYVQAGLGEASQEAEANTTGPMGLTSAADGTVYLTQAIHGPPPDPVLVREQTDVDYDNPYSSSVIEVEEGELTPDEVVARACRNCYEPAVAPEESPFEGELFTTENAGAYRARLAAGEDRTLLEGSTATDQAVSDGITHVDTEEGQIRRVATIAPTEPGTGGMAPTGLAFAPDTVPGHEGEMFAALMSGFSLMTNDRGYVTIVHPDLEGGAGSEERFVAGLDFPIDVTFGPDGSMYVLEFYDGDLWRLTPPDEAPSEG